MLTPSISGGRSALAFIFVTAVLDILAMGIVIPVLPVLIGSFAGSGSWTGFIDGLFFILAVLPTALWGLAMPTLQSLMTRHVSESEQGQLQGANMSVTSIAGMVSPLVFGAVYSLSMSGVPPFAHPGTAFALAALVLAAAVLLGTRLSRGLASPAMLVQVGGRQADTGLE